MRMPTALSLLIWTSCFATEPVAKERGLEVDIYVGHVEGPGLSTELPLSLPWNRRIDAIEDGQRTRLGLRWESDDYWYAFGAFRRSRFSYESPLNEGCPVTPGRFLPPTFACQPSTNPRVGRIEDDHDQVELGIGLRFALGSWLGAYAEVSHGFSRWVSRDDLEAAATAQCLSFRFNTEPRPHPNCVQVNRYARAQGLNAALGLELWPARGFSLTGAVHHQGFRYRIYRNDLYRRFAGANGIDSFSIDFLVDDEPKGSWRWASLQARYDVTPRWALLLNLEGGGNREWETVDLGVRLKL